MNLFLKDPKTGERSVSLSLLLIAFILAAVAIILNIAKVTENTSSSMELFLSCAGLYFGRRMNFKGNVIGPDNPGGSDDSKS